MSDNFAVTTRQNGADMEWVDKATGTVVFALRASRAVDFSGAANIALPSGSGLLVAHAKYDASVDSVSHTANSGVVTPAITGVIPNHAIMVGGVIDVTSDVTSLGAPTVAIGTTAGSAANSLMTATLKGSLTAGTILAVTPTNAVPVKMTAQGSIDFTIAVADLTGGVIEVWVFYVIAAA